MRKFIRTTTLAALLLASIPAAQAAIQNYNFNGALDSGLYSGQTFSGSFSFDDAGLTNFDSEYLAINSLNMFFLGNNYTLSSAVVPAEVAYFNGAFVGINYTVETSDPQFSLIAGYDNVSDAFLAYDTSALGGSGAGSVVFAAVPEPETYALLLAGLGLLGFATRRRAKAA